MQDRIFDVLVVGAGMVGATVACLLARAGFSVAVVEAQPAPEFLADAPVGLRVSALSTGSVAILNEAGAWRQVTKERHCPYRRMRIEDRGENAVLEFNAGEFGMSELGTIVENDLLQWSLWQCLENLGGIELINPAQLEGITLGGSEAAVRLSGGREIRARLLVGADGAGSRLRHELGINTQFWSYGQQGIVAVVRTSVSNTGLAWQRFTSGGPLAFLPLSDGSSSIVWSRPEIEARRLMELDDRAFCDELAAATASESESSGMFGDVLECGQRASFALNMQLSDTYTNGPAVLIGDAAHAVHPLAGQGVNLGLADAAALAETLVAARKAGQDISKEKVLMKYARWRRSEAEIMARGIHGIRSLFTPDVLSPLRRLGLSLVSRSWMAKESFMRRAAGCNRNAPALARGVGLSELMR